MAYLDLDELPDLVGRGKLIADRKVFSYAFRRQDHLFEPGLPLATEIRQIVRESNRPCPTGPVRLLTQLRWLGYYFSPLNLYYLFDASGKVVEQVVAEVNNTPWGERHCYVLVDSYRANNRASIRCEHAKAFHVSPFMQMDATYRWRLTQPAESLHVSLGHIRTEGLLFDANMSLKRSPLTRQALRRAALRYPLMTAQITAAIYYQAAKLWWKGCPFYSHPDKTKLNAGE